MSKKVLIFGYGYVAKFLSKALSKLGYDVCCTSRKIFSDNVEKEGDVRLINFKNSDIKQWIYSSQIVLSTAPPNDVCGDPILAHYLAELLSNENPFLWIGYLSSTGVYGDYQGAWVDERSACHPNSPHAKRRMLTEKRWLDLYTRHNLPVHIFRLSGIYGPGRNCLERIQSGKDTVVRKENHYFSRIHVFDICEALIASIQKPTPGGIYNVSDDEPAPLHEVEQFGAKLIGAPVLDEVQPDEADLSPMAAAFFASNRKVSSKKIVSALGVHWLYPNYRVGLEQGCLPDLKT